MICFYQNQLRNLPFGKCFGVIDWHSLAKNTRMKQRLKNVEKQKSERDRYNKEPQEINLLANI